MSAPGMGDTVYGAILVDDGQYATAASPSATVTGPVVSVLPNMPQVVYVSTERTGTVPVRVRNILRRAR